MSNGEERNHFMDPDNVKVSTKHYRFTVDLWDGHIKRYKMNDEEVGGLRSFEQFKEARSFAIKRLEMSLEKIANRLVKIEQLTESEVT
jgi:hypothetical protein